MEENVKERQRDTQASDSPKHPENSHAATNPGDRIDHSESYEEKKNQLAVDAPDITGDHIEVPAFFEVEEPDGDKKLLHHVKDAEEISDVIRQARVDEDGNRVWR